MFIKINKKTCERSKKFASNGNMVRSVNIVWLRVKEKLFSFLFFIKTFVYNIIIHNFQKIISIPKRLDCITMFSFIVEDVVFWIIFRSWINSVGTWCRNNKRICHSVIISLVCLFTLDFFFILWNYLWRKFFPYRVWIAI